MNNYTDWPPVANYPAPRIDPSFQKQLTLLGGTLIDGRPKLRLIWGQSPKATDFWKGQRRLRYLYKAEQVMVGWASGDGKMYPPTTEPPPFEETGSLVVDPVYTFHDIGIPRWYIEQIMPTAILGQDWDKLRYDYNPETGELEDSLGEIPALGSYEEAFYMIADHEACCGENAFTVGCKGAYRDPQQSDIEYVRWLMFQLHQEAYRYTWEEVPPPEVVVQSLLDQRTKVEEAEQKKVSETEYAIRNSLLTHKGSVFGGQRTWDIGAAFARARKF